MKFVTTALLALLSFSALATPGDLACRGKLNGKVIDVLIGYDYHDKPASLVEISVNDKVVISATEISEKVNRRTGVITLIANDEESTITITRKNMMKAVLTVETDSGLLKVKNLALACEH